MAKDGAMPSVTVCEVPFFDRNDHVCWVRRDVLARPDVVRGENAEPLTDRLSDFRVIVKRLHDTLCGLQRSHE